MTMTDRVAPEVPAENEALLQLTAALRGVFDPELDESIIDLGFVADLAWNPTHQEVVATLTLPTYWCAPNFAYLMVHDTKAALSGLPWVLNSRVTLIDHALSAEVNAELNAHGDAGTTLLPQLEDDSLEQLRVTFLAKAYDVRFGQLLRNLLAVGDATEIADTLLGHLGEDGAVTSWTRPGRAARSLPYTDEDFRKLLDRRSRLGLDTEATAPLCLDSDGNRLTAADLATYIRRSRATKVALDCNRTQCLDLLQVRNLSRHGPLGQAMSLTATRPSATRRASGLTSV